MKMLFIYLSLTSLIFKGCFSFVRLRYVLNIVAIFIFIFEAKSQKSNQIEIINANTLEFDQSLGNNAKRLIGNVQFKHDNALMFCDSAYFYSESNSMDAFGSVRITQGDSLQLFGDSLNYNGTTKKAILRGNIKLINPDIVLTTTFLDYDRTKNVAYYFGGGNITSKKENNTLNSKQGYYYPDSQSFFFKNDVVLVNPDYTIHCDTMQYNSTSKITYFYGPTTINSKENSIYCENGWFNTKANTSKFYKNARFYTDSRIIRGDTLFFNQNSGFGEILNNGSIHDTLENIILGGNLIHVFQKIDSVMITQNALMTRFFDDDTLFLHADTFKLSSQFLVKDSISNRKDTIRTLFAYNRVKFYKSDMQGKSDSLMYKFADSTIHFYNEPIIWSQENQMTADFIYLTMKNKQIHTIHLNQNAFVISKADSLFEHFNQIKGNSMVGYFAYNKIHKIDVVENAETIYYGKDNEGKYIGVNKAHGNNMLIFLENNQLSSLTFIKDPEATLYPIKEPSPKDVKLKGFNWKISQRPLCVDDIFKN